MNADIYRASARTCPNCGETRRVREYTQEALMTGRADREFFDCLACGFTMDVESVDEQNAVTTRKRNPLMSATDCLDYPAAAQSWRAALDAYTESVSAHRAVIANETLIVTMLSAQEAVYVTSQEILHGTWHDSEIGRRVCGKPVQWNLRDANGQFVDSGFAADENEARSNMAYRARSRRADAAISAAFRQMTEAFALMMSLPDGSESDDEAADD